MPRSLHQILAPRSVPDKPQVAAPNTASGKAPVHMLPLRRATASKLEHNDDIAQEELLHHQHRPRATTGRATKALPEAQQQPPSARLYPTQPSLSQEVQPVVFHLSLAQDPGVDSPSTFAFTIAFTSLGQSMFDRTRTATAPAPVRESRTHPRRAPLGTERNSINNAAAAALFLLRKERTCADNEPHTVLFALPVPSLAGLTVVKAGGTVSGSRNLAASYSTARLQHYTPESESPVPWRSEERSSRMLLCSTNA